MALRTNFPSSLSIASEGVAASGEPGGAGWLASSSPLTYQVIGAPSSLKQLGFILSTPIVANATTAAGTASAEITGTGPVPFLHDVNVGPTFLSDTTEELPETFTVTSAFTHTATLDNGYTITYRCESTSTATDLEEYLEDEYLTRRDYAAFESDATITLTVRDAAEAIVESYDLYSGVQTYTGLGIRPFLTAEMLDLTLTESGVEVTFVMSQIEIFESLLVPVGGAESWTLFAVEMSAEHPEVTNADGGVRVRMQIRVDNLIPVKSGRLPLRVMQRGDGRAGGTARWAVGAGRCTPSGTRANGVR